MAKKKAKKKNPKRVAAGKRSKRKGSNFERELANDLEARYGDPSLRILDRNFRRTPMSGGCRSEWPGDLIVPAWFPFAIEAKKYHANENVLDLTTIPHKGDDHQLLKWWDEELPKARHVNKELLIVFCKGRNKPLALADASIISRLDLHLAKGITKEGAFVMAIKSTTRDLICVPYHILFDRVRKEQLEQLANYLRYGDPVLEIRRQLADKAMQDHAAALASDQPPEPRP